MAASHAFSVAFDYSLEAILVVGRAAKAVAVFWKVFRRGNRVFEPRLAKVAIFIGRGRGLRKLLR